MTVGPPTSRTAETLPPARPRGRGRVTTRPSVEVETERSRRLRGRNRELSAKTAFALLIGAIIGLLFMWAIGLGH